jgi:transcriptional regulator with XRE-family HTH domain
MNGRLRSVPRLKELRERRGLTQAELAILSGVPLRTIARHETEPDRKMRREVRAKLAKALKVKPDALGG